MNWKNYLAITGLIALIISSAGAATLPAETNILIQPGVYLQLPGDSWKYNNFGMNLGTTWRAVDYDDSLWPEGVTQFGNGDGDEMTVIDLGPETSRYPTIYFRRGFVVDDASRYTNFTLRVLRDDGAVVYLNGVEVYRNNMPANEITYNTLSSANATTADEQTNFYSRTFFPTNLLSGTNVMAVEVHQNSADSTDLSFDFGLTGVSVPTEGSPSFALRPTNMTIIIGSNAVIRVAVAGTRPLTYQWVKNGTNIDGANDVAFYINNAQLNDSGIYACIASNQDGYAVSSSATIQVIPPPPYDLSKDSSSLERNPSGAWSFGYETNLGTGFALDNSRRSYYSENNVLLYARYPNTPDGPSIGKNPKTTTATAFSGQFVAPPGMVWFVPGTNGNARQFAVIRFTASEAGEFLLGTTAWPLLDGNLAGDCDFHVLKNGSELFGAFLPAHVGATYVTNLLLNLGDTIDFAIGRGMDGLAEGTGLKLDAKLISPQAAAINLPIILSHPMDQKTEVGGDAVFTVTAVGAEPMSYQWMVNGKPIEGATNQSLTLSAVQFDQVGSYSVLITNFMGNATSASANLNLRFRVYDAAADFSPEINPNGVWRFGYETVLGDTFVPFAVNTQETMSGGATIDVWSNGTNNSARINHNGSALTGTSDYGQGNFPPGTLWMLPGATNPDNYSVIRFTVPKYRQGIYELACVVESYLEGPSAGDTDFHIQKNGEELFCRWLSGTNYSATCTTNLALYYGDTIDFIVGRGLDGKATGSGVKIQAALNLAGTNTAAPAILVQPLSRVVSVGSNLTLTVLAVSTMPMQYQWYFNDTAIPDATARSLTLENLQFTNVGNYSVRITNLLGGTISSNATLVIKPQATYDLTRDFSATANPNSRWSFGWESVLGSYFTLFSTTNSYLSQNGVPFRFWSKNASETNSGVYFNPGPNTGTSDNGQGSYPPRTVWLLPGLEGRSDNYAVARFTTSMLGSGYYQVWVAAQPQIVGTNAGDNEFHIMKNSVEVAPLFLRPNTGTAYSNIFWLNRNEPVDFVVGRGADKSAAGSGMKLEATVTPVTTEPLPLSILGAPRDQSLPVGNTAIFSVAPNGAGPFTYQWNFNGSAITGGTKAFLTLTSITLSNAGVYEVTVTDSLGASTSAQATLTVLDYHDGFSDNFDPDYDPFVWSSFAGTVQANNIGGSMSDANSLWFGGTGTRFATTRGLNTTNGGYVSFYIRLADTYTTNWYRPTLTNEQVVFEYSIDGGYSWTLLSRYDDSTYMSWTYQIVNIPAGACTLNTKFRWRQLSNSGANYDHWALDNVHVFIGPVVPQFFAPPPNQAVLEGGTATLSAVVIASQPASYQWQFNGVDLEGATSPSLVLNNVTRSQAGSYTLTVRNDLGEATSQAGVLTVVDMGPSFRIVSLTTNNPAITDHNNLTGDDRGGIAVSASSVFVTGDNSTARYGLEDLSGGIAMGRVYDGLICDLRSAKVYCLGNGTELAGSYPSTVTTLLEIDDMTGQLTGKRINLSMPLNLGGGYSGMVYSGYGRAVIHTGYNNRLYHILLPSGIVVDLGAISFPSHTYSEAWASWGVVEYFGNQLYLDYVQDSYTIVRKGVSDGTMTTLANFSNLSDMASFVVSPYLDRWYWHYEGSGQFGGSSETLGYADATFEFDADAVQPWIVLQPRDQFVLVDQSASLKVLAGGAHPFSYQWRFNGVDILGATNSILSFSGVSATNQGNYSVRVTNPYGSVESSNGLLTVVGWGEDFKIETLTSNNVTVVEHGNLTSSDRGGIANSVAKVFYTGYNITASFNLDDLSGGTVLGAQYPAQVSNLRTEMVYSLGNGTNLINSSSYYNGATVTSLLEHDPLTGNLTGRSIPLTASITLPTYSYIGLFSGFDRIVIHNSSHAYMILMPSGLVVDLGTMPAPPHHHAPSYTYWGIAEYFDNAAHLVTVRDSTSIVRVRAPAGPTNVVATFDDLGYNMFTITASPYLKRWYFHHESWSQFSHGSETLGFADATFTYNDPPRPPEIISQPFSQRVTAGGTLLLGGSAIGTRPVAYQWRFNGQIIPNATNPVLRLQGITLAQEGNYSLFVSNNYGRLESTNAAVSVVQLAGEDFQISDLSTNNANVIEHYQYTGDNRGSIAASSSQVFYSGDQATRGFNLGDLAAGPSPALGCCVDGMVSDLQSERMYSLGHGGVRLSSGSAEITSLLEHDPITGVLNDNRINLSMPISVSGTVSSLGLFPGYGRIVIYNGANVYNIDMPSGIVTEIGTMTPFPHFNSETWAFWGIAEYFQGVVSLVYVRDSQTIVRTRVPDGLTTDVGAFNSLGSMSGFTVSAYLNRWYFHTTGSSQFRSGDETLGFADASFAFTYPAQKPVFVGQPTSQSATPGSYIKLYSVAKGTPPLSYQWSFEGVPIEGATNAILNLSNLTTGQSGRYVVQASNQLGVAISEEAILDVVELLGEPFQILELSTNNFYAIECSQMAGDTRGPIAVSSDQLFYTGDSGTARFNLLDLSNGGNIGVTNDAIVSDLKSGQLYSLGNETSVLRNGGGVVTRLYELDSVTGAATGGSIILSSPIALMNNSTYSGYIGIFSGYGRIVVHDMSHVYDIALPSGTVTDLGAMPPPTHDYTESWAYWGVAEFADGLIYLVYFRDYTTIARTRVPDGFTTNVLTLNIYPALGNGMTLTVSPSMDRWYFHHYGASLFQPNGDETVGFADATFSTTASNTRPPMIARNPANLTILQTNTATLQVLAVGGRPLSYQWQFNGQNLPKGTNSLLVLSNAMPVQSGLYSVIVSNAFGCVTSQPAMLNVWAGLPAERNFRIVSLTTNDPVVVDDYQIAGYERGGIAIGSNRVFHTGSSYTDRYLAADLTDGANFGARYDGLVSNLRTEQVYALGTSTGLIGTSGGVVDTLWELDGDTGTVTTNRIQLSRSIGLGYASGIFSGYDMIVLYSYSQSRVFMIDLPSGQVLDMGSLYLYGRYYNWAYWGVAEQYNNSIYLVYSPDYYSVVRVKIPDGTKTTLSSFNDLGYMTCLTVSPTRGRWYFHISGSSQFGSFNQTLGYATAIFEYPPAISAIPAQTILEDSSTGPLAFSISDRETSSDMLAISAVSSYPELVPNTNIVIEGTGSNRFVTVTPLPNMSGTVTITLTTTNSSGGVGSSSFPVKVMPVNDPPSFEFSVSEYTVVEDSGWFSDWTPDISFSVGPNESQSWSLVLTNDNPQLFSTQPYMEWSFDGPCLVFLPAPNAYGTAVVTGIMHDNGGTNYGGIDVSQPRQITINILPANDPPMFTLNGTEVSVFEDAGPQILPNWALGIAPGPTNESEQAWSFMVATDNPGLFSSAPAINNSGTLTFSTAPNSNGTANATVWLCDDGGTNNGGIYYSSNGFRIVATAVNDAPVAYAQSVSVNENSNAPIVLSASDIEGDPLAFTINTPPAHGTLSGAAPNLVYTPVTNYSGADSFTFTAADGQVSSAPATVSITVISANQTPIAVADITSPSMLHSNATGDAIIALNNSNAVVVFDASRSADVDKDTLSYFWWVKDATACFAEGICTTNLLDLGEWSIVLGVDDGKALGSNIVHIRILTASQAVRELMAQVTSADIPRAAQKSLLNKLKLAIQEFDKGQTHPGLNHLRQFIDKVQDELSSTPELADEIVNAAQEIIYSFAGPELSIATEKLEALEHAVDAEVIARTAKKQLLNFLKGALDQTHKSHLDAAANFVGQFQRKLEEGVDDPDVSDQFSATAQEIKNVLLEYSARIH